MTGRRNRELKIAGAIVKDSVTSPFSRRRAEGIAPVAPLPGGEYGTSEPHWTEVAQLVKVGLV